MKIIVTLATMLLYGTICLAQAKINAQAKTNTQARTNVQTTKQNSALKKIDSLLQVNNAWLEQIEITNSLKQRYKLYPTENIYTMLQLDTKTGMIEQVQWSLDQDKEYSIDINTEDLTYGMGYGSGSFELYPTKNIYQFILIDKTNGRKWHIQWGMESSKRWIKRIYKL